MARIETDPNYTSPTFSRATAATDPFKKEDVQNLAAAVSTHDHSTGKGVAITAIPNGTITSAMIADGTIQAGDLADGSVTSAKIADGTIATADLADASVTNAKLASDTARANLLTNGGFEIWQRGNGPFTVNGAYAADRWKLAVGPGSTLSVSRDSTNQDGAYGYCAAISYTHAAFSTFSQDMVISESYREFVGKTLSFSVRVRVASAGAITAFIWDSVNTYRVSSVHTGNGTYQTLTVTAPIGNSAFFQVGITLNVSCTAYIDNAMLVVGNVAADYAPLHPADDLARCLRYYEIIQGEFMGYAAGTQSLGYGYTYKVRKPVTPTITKAGTWGAINCGQVQTAARTTPNGTAATDSVLIFATALAAGQVQWYAQDGTNYIAIEANP